MVLNTSKKGGPGGIRASGGGREGRGGGGGGCSTKGGNIGIRTRSYQEVKSNHKRKAHQGS